MLSAAVNTIDVPGLSHQLGRARVVPLSPRKRPVSIHSLHASTLTLQSGLSAAFASLPTNRNSHASAEPLTRAGAGRSAQTVCSRLVFRSK